ncbi:HutP family protein [Sporomusa acidovorans]|uniref:Hut operon positive regulatory protein n=1 Tax=Sporomusa acidovorans (strain ATCC 49682 / DSM 3132 / Mol) TaxID=1123286 RepID=A0ABZ3J8I6_SPOA4|nr:HutP family protein [Sporomusa acidovorans]OZC16092.1 Hut operon positive regulatory protein [Sporomusa acidovorans DSM 3132]SDD86914.1 hut operon positive regulatory protein [Sporomusa acidovorans]
MISLGKVAVLSVLQTEAEEISLLEQSLALGYKVYKGKVGSMDSAKIFAAVETAAKREGFIGSHYREEHALYHSILEAYQGICRGNAGLGNVLRSAGLLYSIVRGTRAAGCADDGEWIAVALYGYMGAPMKGFEHEVLGLGMNPI